MSLAQRPRMPAEWEPHEALWLAVPHDSIEWGSFFDAAKQSVFELVSQLLRDKDCERVELLWRSECELAPHPKRRDHVARFGDIWLRDTGPIFVQEGATLTACAFRFNGWGEKFVFPHDTEVAGTIAGLAGMPLRRTALTLEGGAIDGNGEGTILSTRQCLLNSNRNPEHNQEQIEALLQHALGVEHVIWLERGLRGDHTDGHIDNIARFVSPRRVVHMLPANSSDPQAEILHEVHKSLREARTESGEALELIALPSPGKVEGPSGLLAASYCNFLITNRCVVVPTFGVPTDALALSLLADLFPERRIVPLEAYALLTGGGTVHCISQQQPTAAAHV